MDINETLKHRDARELVTLLNGHFPKTPDAVFIPYFANTFGGYAIKISREGYYNFNNGERGGYLMTLFLLADLYPMGRIADLRQFVLNAMGKQSEQSINVFNKFEDVFPAKN